MKVHTLFTLVANTHIIENERGVFVIDAGMPYQAGRIVNTIRALGHAPSDVRLIVLTHGHIDHVGSAVALKHLTGAPVALHRADAPLVATPNLKIPPGRTARLNSLKRALEFFGWVIPLKTFSPDVLLDDGQSLREFGLAARIIHTPGHTAGSISVACADGALFVGDAILNWVRVSFPLFWEDAAATLESACKIQSFKPRICYTGHGRAFDSSALDAFVEKIRDRWETLTPDASVRKIDL